MMPMPPASATAAASGDSEMRTAMPPWMMGSRAVRCPMVSEGMSTTVVAFRSRSGTVRPDGTHAAAGPHGCSDAALAFVSM